MILEWRLFVVAIFGTELGWRIVDKLELKKSSAITSSQTLIDLLKLTLCAGVCDSSLYTGSSSLRLMFSTKLPSVVKGVAVVWSFNGTPCLRIMAFGFLRAACTGFGVTITCWGSRVIGTRLLGARSLPFRVGASTSGLFLMSSLKCSG